LSVLFSSFSIEKSRNLPPNNVYYESSIWRIEPTLDGWKFQVKPKEKKQRWLSAKDFLESSHVFFSREKKISKNFFFFCKREEKIPLINLEKPILKSAKNILLQVILNWKRVTRN
jgi:hypothetical protein